MSRPIAIVVAVAENGVIGRDGGLPWRLGTDLARFKALTWGRPMIMGRRCWESIGRPLPGRETVVLTRRPGYAPPGVTVAGDWTAAKAVASELAERMGSAGIAVVGGAEIYRLALPEAAQLHLTRVHAAPMGDVLFPSFAVAEWRETGRERHPAGPRDEHPFTFIDLVRETPAA